MFGRRPSAPDPRDARYPIQLALAGRGKPIPGARFYTPGKTLDQGATGTCVGHGGADWEQGAPVLTPITAATPFDLYRAAVLVDEWPENDGEATLPDAQLQFGTSVRALAKVLRAQQRLANYLWATKVADIRAFLLNGQGTVILGINWYANMMNPDAKGFLHASGALMGGHCVDTVGWSDLVASGGAVLLQNSWGAGWGTAFPGTGQKGFAWLRAHDLQLLLNEQGECLVGVEQPVAG